jgi:hypothetical protein
MSGASGRTAFCTVDGVCWGPELWYPFSVNNPLGAYLMREYLHDDPEVRWGRGTPPFPFDVDREWRARVARSELPIEIFRTDGTVTHTIQTNGKVAIVSSHVFTSRVKGERSLEMLEHGRRPCVSADGRYLAFQRIKCYVPADGQCQLGAGLTESIDIVVLDLQTGQESLLASVPPDVGELIRYSRSTGQLEVERSVLHGYVYLGDAPEFAVCGNRAGVKSGQGCSEQSALPMAWSEDGKLAVWNENVLYVFHAAKSDAKPVFLSRYDVRQTRIRWIEFWSDRYLLLLGEDSMWRVEVGDRVEHECPVSFLPYDKGTTGCLAVVH